MCDPITIPAAIVKAQEGYLISYFPIVNYLQKKYGTDDSILSVHSDTRRIIEERFESTRLPGETLSMHPLCTKSLQCRFIYTEKIFKGISVKTVS